MRFQQSFSALGLAALLALAGCGGGSGDNTADTTPRTRISAVKVFGDSLQDSGTFGFRFTVAGVENPLYVERVAGQYGQTLCNFYVFTGATFAPNSRTGCTNFAIGGGRVNYVGQPANDPRNVPVQLATATLAGNFAATDLLIVDGGGNDAADLVRAFFAAQAGSITPFQNMLLSIMTPAQVAAALSSGAASIPTAGGQYMTLLADRLYDSVKTLALDKGAQQIVLLNLPGILNTPQFQTVLNQVAATSGAGARAQLESLFKSWIEAYNRRLAERAAGEARVALVDFYTEFNTQFQFPTQFGLSNVTTMLCPAGFPDAAARCTATYLSANPPAGQTADWWKTYAFSDDFHPTPYGHQLVSQLISRAIAAKGWL